MQADATALALVDPAQYGPVAQTLPRLYGPLTGPQDLPPLEGPKAQPVQAQPAAWPPPPTRPSGSAQLAPAAHRDKRSEDNAKELREVQRRAAEMLTKQKKEFHEEQAELKAAYDAHVIQAARLQAQQLSEVEQLSLIHI